MKAKIPKVTKISGTRWRVIPKRTVTLDGEDCAGLCHYDQHTIEVSVSSECEYTIMCNFWHEWFHAIVHEAGVTLDNEVEHAITKQVEKHLASNVDWRETQRREKKKKAKK